MRFSPTEHGASPESAQLGRLVIALSAPTSAALKLAVVVEAREGTARSTVEVAPFDAGDAVAAAE